MLSKWHISFTRRSNKITLAWNKMGNKGGLISEEKHIMLSWNYTTIHKGDHQMAFVAHHDRRELGGEGGGGGDYWLTYPSWASSGGRWEGRRAGRRRWTLCLLAASGAFRSPPLTETGSSSETVGNWCLWTFARRWAELAWGTLPFPWGHWDAELHCLGFFFLVCA